MKKLSLFLNLIIVAAVLFLVAVIISKFGINLQSQDSGRDYLTKEDVIEMFYENYGTFKEVSNYVLEMPGTFYCDRNTGTLLLSIGTGNGRENLNIENLVVGEEVERILYEFGFTGIYENETGTKVDFGIPYELGGQGIIFSQDGLVESRFFTPLEEENWYYYFVIHGEPEIG